MTFIRNGLHMVAIKEGSVINIQPNPKFKVDDVKYGAIMLNDTPIGVYPLTDSSNTSTARDVYTIFDSIIRQIENNIKVITIPSGYKFKSMEEFETFKNALKDYSKSEMIDIYYESLSHIK